MNIIINMERQRPMESVLDFWAQSLHCPVCDQGGLGVIREPGVPDLLHCSRCESEFEVSEGGERVRLLKYPLSMGPDLYAKWLPIAVIRRTVLENIQKGSPSQPSFIAVTGESRRPARPSVRANSDNDNDSPPDKALEQARRLLSLGNSLDEVRLILEKDPRLNPSQIERILDRVDQPRKSQALEKLLMGILIGLVLLVGIFFLSSTGLLERGRIFIAGVLSGEDVQLIPPTPVVYRYAPQGIAFGCPPTQQGAAAAFGGVEEHWTFDGKNWMYTDIKAVRIFVPEGLTARYTYFNPIMVLEKVSGPVAVDPVMMISIDCYH